MLAAGAIEALVALDRKHGDESNEHVTSLLKAFASKDVETKFAIAEARLRAERSESAALRFKLDAVEQGEKREVAALEERLRALRSESAALRFKLDAVEQGEKREVAALEERLAKVETERNDAQQCVVCMESPRAVVLYLRSHFSLCAKCAARCAACPVCRFAIAERRACRAA